MGRVEFYAIGDQNVKPNEFVVFTNATAINNNSIIHREGSGVATVRSSGCGCSGGKSFIKADFCGNVSIPATVDTGETAASGTLELEIAVSGVGDPTTSMQATPAAASEPFNVGRRTDIITLNGCCTEIAVVNTSNGTITVNNPHLILDDGKGV